MQLKAGQGFIVSWGLTCPVTYVKMYFMTTILE